MKTTINDSWHIDDVKCVREDLTDEQCYEVLKRFEQRDMSYEFEILEYIAAELYPEKD